MRAFRAEEIRGNWATVMLKIREDESIDLDELKRQIRYYVECGVDGVYTNGTAGEFYNQTFEEYAEISAIVAEICEQHHLPFQIGASHMSPVESLRRIELAASLEPAAIQVILPDWFPPNRETQVAFLRGAAKAARGIGLVLYNPPHAKVVLRPEDYLDLMGKADGIVGIKTAGGDDEWYRKMAPVLERISVFIPGHFLASGIARGARGAYSNVAALNPRAAQEWYDIIARDPERGMEIERGIVAFMKEAIDPFILRDKYPNHACDKFMAYANGWGGMTPRLRWPYIGIPCERREAVLKILQRTAPFFLHRAAEEREIHQ